MFFLIEFDRVQSKRLAMQTFEDTDVVDAQNASATLEADARQEGRKTEVVLLQGSTLEVVKRTHARYFEQVIPSKLKAHLDTLLA